MQYKFHIGRVEDIAKKVYDLSFWIYIGSIYLSIGLNTVHYVSFLLFLNGKEMFRGEEISVVKYSCSFFLSDIFSWLERKLFKVTYLEQKEREARKEGWV